MIVLVVMIQIDFANENMVMLGHAFGKAKIQPGAINRQEQSQEHDGRDQICSQPFSHEK
jgi:hypothetical protein